MKVVIIGSGNVATVLGKKIIGAGHHIIQIIGRNEESVKELAYQFNCDFSYKLNEINQLGDIYIIAVADKAVGVIAENLKLNKQLVVHTAASVSARVLAGCSSNYGVLYPLQTLHKELLTLPSIPVMVDGNSDETTNQLIEFATQFADSVAIANDKERLKIHLAAVFANNFTNHLFSIADSLINVNSFSFSQLLPLIKETIVRIESNSPVKMQTGPAIRNDEETIARHRKILHSSPAVLNVYDAITASIVAFYK